MRAVAHTARVLGVAGAIAALALAQQPAPPPSPAPVPAPPVEQEPKPQPKPQEPQPKPQPPSTEPEPGAEPAPAPQPQGDQPPPAPAPKPEPIDPTRAAAELLRKRLGLQPGPVGAPPAGPVVPAVPPPGPGGAPGTVAPATALPETDARAPSQDPSAPTPQDPPPAPTPQDPTQQAADALRRVVLPGAKDPQAAPIPNAQGTPEPAFGPPTVGGARQPRERAVPVWGWFGLMYRGRHGDGTSDHDLIGQLRATVGDEQRDPVTAHIAARGYGDLDGTRTDDSFAGLDESLGDDWNGRLYSAFLDVHRLGVVDLVRAGRQDLEEAPVFVSFDGLRVDSARFAGPTSLWFSAYGGVPVHHFEVSSSGDSVYGAAAGFVPWQGGRVRLDAMRLEDELLALEARDDLLGVRWWQAVGEWHVHGVHTWIDGRPRDLDVGAHGQVATWFELDVDYRELLTTQRQQVTELDPFFTVLGEYAPYRQIDAVLRRGLGDHVDVSVGAEVRRLRDDAREGDFNREFERLHADVAWNDAFTEGLSLAVTGSTWDTNGEDIGTLTGEVAWQRDKGVRLAAGSGYDLFHFDDTLGEERLHVRTWYVRADLRLSAAVQLAGGYELERNDEAEYHLFRVGITWTF